MKQMSGKKENQGTYYNYYGSVIILAGLFSLFTIFVDIVYLNAFHSVLFIINLTFLLFYLIAYAIKGSISGTLKELFLIISCILIASTFLITISAMNLKKTNPTLYHINLVIMIFYFLIISIGSIVKMQQNFANLNQISNITGLGNTRWISGYVDHRIKNGVERGILLLVGIKNFRMINSIYGREFGNDLILIFAEHLRPYISEQIQGAHLGGIEFCLWIERENRERLLSELGTVQREIRDQVRAGGEGINLFFHTAGVIFPDHGINFNQLFARANMAMEKTLVNGQSSHLFYRPDIELNFKRENFYSYEIQKSLENGDFYMSYQKKYNMSGTEIHGVEALARCHSPVLGEISPEVFIPIIHTLCLTDLFTEMIIELVLKEMGDIKEAYGENIQVSINIPPSFFHYYNLFSFLEGVLYETNVNPMFLIFEITEDIFIDDFEVVNEKIKKIQDLGIEISLDDFGTGFSSFAYMQNLPIQELKIDKSFIDRIADCEKSFVLVKAICDIARANNYRVVAEGVEREDQVVRLRETTCDMVQGFIYSKPKRLKVLEFAG